MNCRRAAGLVFSLTLAVGCQSEAPEPPSTTAPLSAGEKLNEKLPDDLAERANLLNLGRGASVVSRTGEVTLDSSAIHAIDGDVMSAWISPPGNPEQTLVYSLPARSRIEQVGIHTAAAGNVAKQLQFDTSLDGVQFTPLAKLQFEAGGPHLVDVTPTEALYLRVRTLDTDRRYVQLTSLHVRGKEVAPRPRAPLGGCWNINGRPAVFQEIGSYLHGRLDGAPENDTPTYFEGGVDGRLFRFAWSKGAQHGYAAITVTPDGKHLTGTKWQQDPLFLFISTSWYGERVDCGKTAPPTVRADVPRLFFERRRFYPLYGLRFDPSGKLDEVESSVLLESLPRILATMPPGAKLIAHEFRGESAEEAMSVARRELDTLRDALVHRGVKTDAIELVPTGVTQPRHPPLTVTTRSMYSVIELHAPPDR